MKTLTLLLLLVALCGCAATWDVGKGSVDIRRNADPKGGDSDG